MPELEVFEEALSEEVAFEDEEGGEAGKPKKPKGKKAAKKRQLVFDEELGQMVPVTHRKTGQRLGHR